QLKGIVVDNTELFNQRLQEWEHFYNFDRPHGGLGGQTPYERLRERTNASSVPDLRQMNMVGGPGFEPGALIRGCSAVVVRLYELL
ncbi:MAG: hypothetical protein ACHQ0J_09035, partial [Candidatus Dormibacterales bacterium]